MKKFKLNIKLGNEAMQTLPAVAAALRKLADKLDYGCTEFVFDENGNYECTGFVFDENGNTVGKYELT